MLSSAFRHRHVVCCVGVAGVLISATVNAAVIAYERFDYADIKPDNTPLRATAGTPAANGGAGWGGSWASSGANDFFRTGGLTHPDLRTGGGHAQTTTFQTTGSLRPLANSLGADNTTVWLRFLIARDATDTAGSGGFAGLSLFDGASSERLFVGKRSSESSWGVQRAGGGASANSSLAISSPAMMLVQINFALGAETVNLWTLTGAAPEEEGDLGTPNASISATDFSFNHIRIASGNNNVYNFDEIFLATTYESLFPPAIPEPNTLVFFMMGISLFALRRRFLRNIVTPA